MSETHARAHRIVPEVIFRDLAIVIALLIARNEFTGIAVLLKIVFFKIA
jgi:hypothetical protein